MDSQLHREELLSTTRRLHIGVPEDVEVVVGVPPLMVPLPSYTDRQRLNCDAGVVVAEEADDVEEAVGVLEIVPLPS